MRALIAMSGGVDSSLAAKLMKDRGFDYIGCTMKLYHNEDIGVERSRTCCSLDDVEDARSVAYKLGMPFYVFNFTDVFRDTVIRKFIESYENGITPNPCIDCSRYMKFDKLFERAKILGCDYIVTGHYASVIELQTGKRSPQGNFVDKKGNILGRHKGVIHYTIGQRKGLGISHAEPLYVCGICPKNGNVILGSNDDTFSREANVSDFNWISGEVPGGEFRCKAKIRYRQVEQWATVIPTGTDTVHITFDEPQWANTPGQAAVLYDGDVVLGGGTIYE